MEFRIHQLLDRWLQEAPARPFLYLPDRSPSYADLGRPADALEAQLRPPPVRSAAPAPVAVAAAAPRAATVPARSTPAPVAPAPTLSQQVVGAVMVQVASFSSRDNATRAMGQLNAAGIVGATISDIAAGGRTLFRLRVPASDHASAAELVGRIAGLGLGSPQIVKD